MEATVMWMRLSHSLILRRIQTRLQARFLRSSRAVSPTSREPPYNRIVYLRTLANSMHQSLHPHPAIGVCYLSDRYSITDGGVAGSRTVCCKRDRQVPRFEGRTLRRAVIRVRRMYPRGAVPPIGEYSMNPQLPIIHLYSSSEPQNGGEHRSFPTHTALLQRWWCFASGSSSFTGRSIRNIPPNGGMPAPHSTAVLPDRALGFDRQPTTGFAHRALPSWNCFSSQTISANVQTDAKTAGYASAIASRRAV